jgi:farnesyl-diphosphate farnesyltransferase
MSAILSSTDIGGGENPDIYQTRALPGVSRTFALTIPQLPEPLHRVVTNAYLLCRIADTIEDDPGIGFEETSSLHKEFIAVVAGDSSASLFAIRASRALSDSICEAEKDLVRNCDLVIQVTHSFSVREREALIRCVSIMCDGMPGFQKTKGLSGLRNVNTLDRYCYFVAGVVGETLTELFCCYSPEIDEKSEQLAEHAVCFGQGLQMTNIIKDMHDDRANGSCWLPRDVFKRAGFDLAALQPGCNDLAFANGLDELIGIALAHLRHALTYTLLIPSSETGIRRFCLWAIGLALLTLRKVQNNKTFSTGSEVKVTRATVRSVVLATRIATRNDILLKILFKAAASGLPDVSAAQDPCPANISLRSNQS